MIKAVKAIICINNKYLLQLRDKHKNIYYPNFWGLFGGTIEKKETPVKAIIREIKEEINLDIKVDRMILNSKFKFHDSKNIFETFFYQCQSFNKNKISLKEGQDFGFFLYKDVIKLKIIPYDLVAITYYHHTLIKKKKYILE
jgi:8-oxo-dGTP diphosphatase